MPERRGRGRSRNCPSRRGRSNSISTCSRRCGSRGCAPSHMEKRGGGSIINIGSIYGRESGGPLTYNASKAALHSFTKMLAREYRAEKYPRQHDRSRLDTHGRRNLGAAVSRESSVRERFHQPRDAGRTPRPSRRSRVRGRDARVAARELDHRREHPGGRRAGTLDPLMSRFFSILSSLLPALTFIGCSSPLPTTELPPARYIQAAPEFPGFHDYRGIVDLPMKASGMDQVGNRGPGQDIANRFHFSCRSRAAG